MEHASPDLYQPRLTRWGHTWRLTMALLLSALLSVTALRNEWRQAHWLAYVDLALGVASFGLVLLRRRYPFTIALVTVAFGLLSASASGPSVLAVVSLATRRRWWQLAVVAAVNIAVSLGYNKIAPSTPETRWWVTLSVTVAATLAVVSWGAYVGSRRELVWTLKHRAERAEAEQELRTAQARVNERARIAREMHDVLAHRISQLSMHANALAFRTDLDADQMRASATIIQETAHQALTDLRGVLGVLRDPVSGQPLEPPQPTYCDLVQLVDSVRAAGLPVTYDDRLGVTGRELPDVIGRTVYRIVQEGMTNAAKHAPGATLRIVVSGSPDDGVTVELSNPLGFRPSTTPGAGLGLVGLAERAELRGGHLVGQREGASWVLRGWIPWAA